MRADVGSGDLLACRRRPLGGRSARAHDCDLRAPLPAAGPAVAFRQGDAPVGREVAVFSAGAISSELACALGTALEAIERLSQLVGDLRSAVALVLIPGRDPACLPCRVQL